MMSWHCRDNSTCAHHGGIKSLQCFLGTSKEDGSSTTIELDINVIVSSVSTSTHGKFDANALQPKKAFVDIIIVVVAKATGMNSFLPSIVDHPSLIYISSV